LDSLGKDIEDITSIHPGNIERATFVLPDEKFGKTPLVILFTREPYSHDRLRDHLRNKGRHRPQETNNGKRMYVPVDPSDTGVLAFSDRILVLGDSETISRVADRPDNGTGPLTPMLERAAQSSAVVVGVHPSPEMVLEFTTRQLRLGREAEPVAAL